MLTRNNIGRLYDGCRQSSLRDILLAIGLQSDYNFSAWLVDQNMIVLKILVGNDDYNFSVWLASI